jgi:nitric oxide reductase activation protein
MLENSGREWREGGYRSGTLHRPALASTATGKAEVFARRFSEDGIDSAVAIMLDVSGSMFPAGGVAIYDDKRLDMVRRAGGMKSRIATAVATTAALLETTAQAGADSMVLAFGSDSKILKRWGQPWKKTIGTLRRLHGEGDTNDYAAARFATEALMGHPAQRKILIAITDGEGNQYQTRIQIEAARNLGIQVIGIGIELDASETYGPGTVNINSLGDLGTVAFSRIRGAK